MPRDIPQLKGFSEQSHWEESRESGPEAQQHQGKDDDEFVTLNHDDVGSYSDFFRRPPMNDKTNQRDRLHPFVQTLSISNVEDCVRVEEGAFPEHERCSREKFIYRLTKCPELCLGLFSLPTLTSSDYDVNARPTLLAHIVATRTPTATVTDDSMSYPSDWQSRSKAPSTGPVGHQEHGSTIAIHSLAVVPEHQGKKLGTTIIKSYIQRMKDAGVGERIALLTHEPLVGYYETFGFKKLGSSGCTFGGGNWFDLVLDFKELQGMI